MGRKKVSKYILQDSIPKEEKLKKALELLDLTGAAQRITEINDKARKAKLSHADFLDQLLEVELYAREDARLMRWKKQARFQELKTLETFDFSVSQLIEKERSNTLKDIIYNLIDCEWIKRGGNIAFFGPPGVGKTHLSIALGLKAIECGHESRFITARELVDMLNDAIDKDQKLGGGEHRKKLLSMFSNIPLLILDDLTFSKIDSYCSEFLFQLFLGRYDAKKSTIITGNEGFKTWIDALFSGDEVKTSVVVDRFVEDCERINIEGDSYRVTRLRKQGIKNLELTKKDI